jgi:hypothetical protein
MRTPPLPHTNPPNSEFRNHLGELAWIMTVKADLLALHASIGDDTGAERDILGIIDLAKSMASTMKNMKKLKEDRSTAS